MARDDYDRNGERNRRSGSMQYGQGIQGEQTRSGSGEHLGGSQGRGNSGRGSDYGNTGSENYGGGGFSGGGGYGSQQGGGTQYGGSQYGMSGGFGGYGGGTSHVGRGPKGWTRSDDRIREDVNEQLERHPQIDASEIEVKVEKGEVTLTGTIDNRRSKHLAEDLAEQVSGVQDVHNQIRVKREGGMLSQLSGSANEDEHTQESSSARGSSSGIIGGSGGSNTGGSGS